MNTRPSTLSRPDPDDDRAPVKANAADVVDALDASRGASTQTRDADALAGVRFLRSFEGLAAGEAILGAIRLGHASE